MCHERLYGQVHSVLLNENTSREGLATADKTNLFGRKPEIRNQVFDGEVGLPWASNTTTVGVQWLKTSFTDWNQANREQPDEREYESLLCRTKGCVRQRRMEHLA